MTVEIEVHIPTVQYGFVTVRGAHAAEVKGALDDSVMKDLFAMLTGAKKQAPVTEDLPTATGTVQEGVMVGALPDPEQAPMTPLEKAKAKMKGVK